MDAIALINEHIPSLTEENDGEIDYILGDMVVHDRYDNADLAIRTCKCGLRIDGFYEYVDHLKEVFRGAEG